MKRLSPALRIIFIFILVSIISCNVNSLRGKKLYLMDLTVNTVPLMKEIECDFIGSDKVEIRMTLFGYADEFKTYKTDSTIYQESKIYTYSYNDGILEIPDLKVIAKLTEDDKGNYLTNTNEVFYSQSIVGILNTQEAKNRIIKASPMANIAGMYLDMLKNSPNGNFQVTEKNGKLYSSQSSNQQTDIPMDTAKKGNDNMEDERYAKEVQKGNDSIKWVNGNKPDLELNEMIEFVKRDHFTINEIKSYLAKTSTAKVNVLTSGSKIIFSENDNDMEYDPYKYTFSIDYNWDDHFNVIINQLNKSGYKKTVLNPASDEKEDVLYQNKNYLISCVRHFGGTEGNTPCTITISRAQTFSNN